MFKKTIETKAEKPTTAIGPIELNDGELETVAGGPLTLTTGAIDPYDGPRVPVEINRDLDILF